MFERCIDQLGTRPTTQACVLNGYGTGDLSVHRPMLNPLSYTSQGLLGYFESLKSRACAQCGTLLGDLSPINPQHTSLL